MKFRKDQRGQRGVAAVEMAVIMPILVLVFLMIPLFFARCFWHYSVAQKAARNAVHYLATVPAGDMRNPGLALDAAKVADYIARAETAALNPGGPYQVNVNIDCLPAGCGNGSPSTVKVRIAMRMFDPIFDFATWPFSGEEGLLLIADVEMFYVGK